MLLIIDNTQRNLRDELRKRYMKNGIPCAVSDLEHAADYMPCALIQVTEKYLYDDAVFLADMYGGIPVYIREDVMAIEVMGRPHIEPLRFGSGVCFCSKRLYLTKTERLILNMLLMYDGGRVSPENAAKYCMKSPDVSSIRVHICNINAKAKRATGIELIDCRRYEGYKLHEF